ncbi:putative 3-phosphoinositide-dependent protein kinase 2 isoform X2 [Oscarella lobularis]|uniref:putative 3-phosphoinositide-dependent protein kinase 2 isoform X2 n=1 Tax=Oscarella lobularis TaxID=121494 RepID=UPI0033132EC4
MRAASQQLQEDYQTGTSKRLFVPSKYENNIKVFSTLSARASFPSTRIPNFGSPAKKQRMSVSSNKAGSESEDKEASEGGATSRKSTSGPSGRKPQSSDFEFGKILGEGSYSTVVYAKDKKTGKEYAIKILEKKHIMKEKKVKYVSREKEVLSKLDHPFFVRLYFTFQDAERLYFGLSFAKRGEILPYIQRVGCFDVNCTQFYTAEIVLALEYMHGLGIIHRDLKPENVLLDENMHIQVTDFGTAKILDSGESDGASEGENRANSFVGTAEYVSPELLTDKAAQKSSDLWALGCILYQLLAGLPPFHAANEYQCFQKITKLDFIIPEGFPEDGADLVRKILVIDPTKRFGCEECGGYPALKAHSFYKGIKWETLHKQTPPSIMPYLPSTSKDGESLHSDFRPRFESTADDFDDHLLQAWGLKPMDPSKQGDNIEREKLLAKQARESPWHRFTNNELIVKTGLVDKRKGLFARRRQLILTDAPHLYYVDPVAMELKGEIPWSSSLRTEMKNFKIFFVHTPNRTYYLEAEGQAQDWCKAIDERLSKKGK